jgi:hypothetical protein
MSFEKATDTPIYSHKHLYLIATQFVDLMRNVLKTAITAYIRNISQADLQTVFAKKKLNGFRPV